MFVRQLSSVLEDDPVFTEWCRRQTDAILENPKVIAAENIPTLIEEVEKRDISFLRDS